MPSCWNARVSAGQRARPSQSSSPSRAKTLLIECVSANARSNAAGEALARVVEDLPAVLDEVARVVELAVRRVPAALERQRSDHGLDRGAGRIQALRGAVDERAAGRGQRARRLRGSDRSSATTRSRARDPCAARSRTRRRACRSRRARSSRRAAPRAAARAGRRRRSPRRPPGSAARSRAHRRDPCAPRRGNRWRIARCRRGRRSPTSSRRCGRTSCASGSGVRRRARPSAVFSARLTRELRAVGGQDQPALDRELLHDLVGVVAARRERGLRPQLPVGREAEQQHEAPREHGVDPSDCAVHARASRRARSEMAHSRASATQLATSDDPP